eukprot:TRINITY_DN18368_c0_g1_i1.p1 TRINITY_DN18368_c0_g1~~TRINITY_DN18368_c0_g1_i1.p1  ORF type:complete len:128 (-),score=26.23 TRINITY_DN18368_c0_g1_i1:59-442(-)
MNRRPPRSTQSRSSAASDVYKRQDVVVREYDTKKLFNDQVLYNLLKRDLEVIRKVMKNKFDHLVNVVDYFENGNMISVVMEYCEEAPLSSYIQSKGQLSEVEAYEIFCQLIKGYQSLEILGLSLIHI